MCLARFVPSCKCFKYTQLYTYIHVYVCVYANMLMATYVHGVVGMQSISLPSAVIAVYWIFWSVANMHGILLHRTDGLQQYLRYQMEYDLEYFLVVVARF